MKLMYALTLGLFLFAPAALFSQSMEGKWLWDGVDQEGHPATHTLEYKADGTLTVDFESNGSIEIRSTYTEDGNQITIKDITEGSVCSGKTGVYIFTIVGDTATAKLVSDECEQRKESVVKMKLKRA